MSQLASFAVETLLVPSALGRSIVLLAPRVGALTATVLPTAKLATEIQPARVAGMREEANPAVAAAHCATLQVRTVSQDGIQRDLILTNERLGAIVLVPILAKGKNFRDGYSKTTRFSVKMLIVFGIPSSYPLNAQASRGRAGIFHASAETITPRIRTTDPRVSNSPTSSSFLAPQPRHLPTRPTYLERKKHTPTMASTKDPTSTPQPWHQPKNHGINQRTNFFLSR
jgi:hypothetical protein